MFPDSQTRLVIRTPRFPTALFLVRVDGAQHCWQAQKRFYLLRLSVLEPKPIRWALDRQPPLLHSKGDVEAGLVSAGFPL